MVLGAETCPGPPAASASSPALDKTIHRKGLGRWSFPAQSGFKMYWGDRCGVVAGSSLGQVRKLHNSFTITVIL